LVWYKWLGNDTPLGPSKIKVLKKLFQRISKAPPQLQTLWKLNLILTSVACAIGPSVNPLQNTETQHVNIVLQCMDQIFWTAQYQRNSCLNWTVSLQVLPHSQPIFLPKPDFKIFIWIFSSKNHLKINISHILNPNLTK